MYVNNYLENVGDNFVNLIILLITMELRVFNLAFVSRTTCAIS